MKDQTKTKAESALMFPLNRALKKRFDFEELCGYDAPPPTTLLLLLLFASPTMCCCCRSLWMTSSWFLFAHHIHEMRERELEK